MAKNEWLLRSISPAQPLGWKRRGERIMLVRSAWPEVKGSCCRSRLYVRCESRGEGEMGCQGAEGGEEANGVLFVT
jgi:hypothetical protein